MLRRPGLLRSLRLSRALSTRPQLLITGATGLVGQRVCDQLEAQGIALRRCDRPPSQDGNYVQCDLADAAALREACRDCDAVVHLGGVSGPGCVFEPPVDAGCVAATNVIGTMNESPVNAVDTYAASKIAGEQLCRAYAAEGLVDTVSLRLGWVYGPGRTTGCDVRGLLQGEPSSLDPAHARNYIYVDDAATALISAAVRPDPFAGMAVNVSGEYVAHQEVEQAVESLGCAVERQHAAAPDPLVGKMDLTRAAAELDWRPRIKIEEGVSKYAKHLGVFASRRRTPI
ncbi:hypothetical protein EMIHUDRAFT_233187 [Emiliania huxleyi CCMP1516]|uniref:NAD-dependent epimerase/dehydratase domain-containing protein n=2 Tax=Emiliania huxleyi TaxID=2903 RepID=A0A0D3K381_EMIH1|nr:hypothetical protein EMIHUDRAFT_233187 [Emiliania huxleyi CCMP1516]EOD30216.1 hypothetical protein EMIHUDRAFT_233187 [Emiliania huxleyi CCMP1516]|eukprot:XP_005782645.1 hypothetical protein EMIHUDRAFT_233187 [Emiliania huxleyi CCMP1516]